MSNFPFLEKDLNFTYVKDPLKDLFELEKKHLEKISEKIFNQPDDRLISWYLGLGDCYALSSNKNKNIVMDRHILLNYFWRFTMDIKKHLIITGNSTVSWKDAIVKAIQETSKSIDYLSEVKILDQRAGIDGNKISEYFVDLDISFTVDLDRKNTN